MLVGLLPYRLYHFERPEKLGFQFLILFGFNVFDVQLNLLTRRIASRFHIFVMSILLKLLGMAKVLSVNNH